MVILLALILISIGSQLNCVSCDNCTVYNLNSYCCVPLCPTGFTQTGDNCESTEDLTLIELDLLSFTTLESSCINDFCNLNSDNETSVSSLPLLTYQMGLFFNQSSYLKANNNYVPAPYFIICMWINPVATSIGTIFQLKKGDDEIVSIKFFNDQIKISILVNENLSNKIEMIETSVNLNTWQRFVFTLRQIENGIEIEINDTCKITNADNVIFDHQINDMWYIIGDDDEAFIGFLSWISFENRDSTIFNIIEPIYNKPPYIHLLGDSYNQSCEEWPKSFRSDSCSSNFLTNCANNTGYGIQDCNNCKIETELITDIENCYMKFGCSNGSFLICTTCLLGFIKIDNTCTYPPTFYQESNANLKAIDIIFDHSTQFYGGIFKSGNSDMTWAPLNNPQFDDPIFLKYRGLFFNKNSYLEAAVPLILNYQFTIASWIRPLDLGVFIAAKNLLIKIGDSFQFLILLQLPSPQTIWVSNRKGGNIIIGEWVYITVSLVLDDFNTHIHSYLNGIKIDSSSFNGPYFISDPNGLFLIGKDLYNTFCEGFMYTFTIWHTGNADFNTSSNVCGTNLNSECLWGCNILEYYDKESRSCINCPLGCYFENICGFCYYPDYYNCPSYNIYYYDCKEHYFLTRNGCIACDAKCKECTGPGSNDCEECYENAQLVGGKCECNETYLWSGTNCVFCIGNDCLDCSVNGENYFLADGVCEVCDKSCKTCNGSGPENCTGCKDNAQLNGSSCDCNEGYHFDVNKSCSLCLTVDCVDCDYYGENFYIDSRKCVKCHDLCKKCYGPGEENCTLCNDPFNFNGTNCICNPGYFLNGNSCSLCKDENCADCWGLEQNQCENCNSGFFNINNVCITCSESEFFNNNTLNCESCMGLCKICNDSKGCDECEENAYFNETSCLCGLGFSEVGSKCIRIQFEAFAKLDNNLDIHLLFSEKPSIQLNSSSVTLFLSDAKPSFSMKEITPSNYLIILNDKKTLVAGKKLTIKLPKSLVSEKNSILSSSLLTVLINKSLNFNSYDQAEAVANKTVKYLKISSYILLGTSFVSGDSASFFTLMNIAEIFSYACLFDHSIDSQFLAFLKSIRPSSLIPNPFEYFIVDNSDRQLTNKYKNFGFESTIPLLNSGGFYSIFLVFLVFSTFTLMLLKITEGIIQKFFVLVHNFLHFKAYTRLWIQSTFELSLICTVSLINYELKDFDGILSFIVSIATLVKTIQIYNFFSFTLLIWIVFRAFQLKDLEEKMKFEAKFSAVFEEFYDEERNQTLFYLLFVCRRYFISATIIFSRSYVVQLTVAFVFSLSTVFYVLSVRPFRNSFQNFNVFCIESITLAYYVVLGFPQVFGYQISDKRIGEICIRMVIASFLYTFAFSGFSFVSKIIKYFRSKCQRTIAKVTTVETKVTTITSEKIQREGLQELIN